MTKPSLLLEIRVRSRERWGRCGSMKRNCSPRPADTSSTSGAPVGGNWLQSKLAVGAGCTTTENTVALYQKEYGLDPEQMVV